MLQKLDDKTRHVLMGLSTRVFIAHDVVIKALVGIIGYFKLGWDNDMN